jgi:group I intron endonuclease
MTWTIYCHIHIESGRRYIGQTKQSVRDRWSRHIRESRKNVRNTHFLNAIRKYGEKAFTCEILEENIQTLEAANNFEKYYIAKYDSTNPESGFNTTKGGDIVHNPWLTPGFREKHYAILKATMAKPEVLKAMSRGAKEAIKRPEVRENRRIALMKIQTPELQAKRSITSQAVWAKPEVRARSSISAKKAWSDPEVRSKKLAAMRDPAFRERISEILRKSWRRRKEAQEA